MDQPKKRKNNSHDSKRQPIPKDKMDTVVFPRAQEIVSSYRDMLRSFQFQSFQEWFDKYAADNFCFFMMRLQEHSLYPVSVYKEVMGKASSCNFIYTRLMSMPDGVFNIKVRGVYPSITDPDALCMIVCDYESEGTKLYETEAIEEEEEGETDQHQNDLELAIASLNHMAHYKQQNEMPLDNGVFEESARRTNDLTSFGEHMDDEVEEGDTRYTSCDSSVEEDDEEEEIAARHSTAGAAATEETPDAGEESDAEPSSNSSLSSASFLPPSRLRGAQSTTLSTNSSVVTVTTNDSSYRSAPTGTNMPPLPPNAETLSSSGSNSPAASLASSDTAAASVTSNSNGTSYHALASTSTSITATVLGLLPQQIITKTVFKQKIIRLVDRIPIFVAKPDASFRLGEQLPQGGVPFKLSARVEFYINRDEKVYKLRNLMN